MPDDRKPFDQEKRLNLCGIHIKNIRLDQQLTLADIQATLELEYNMFLDRTNLGRIENGERTVTEIELAILANLLGVSIERLLWGEISPNSHEMVDVLKKVKVRHATRRPRQSENT